MKISLDTKEILQSAVVGVMRQTENIKLGRVTNHGADPKDAWGLHVAGALAEMALAKALGVYWSGAHGFRSRDVLGYEVRTTHHQNGRLIVHGDDDDEAKFALVVGRDGTYDIPGWVYGYVAKSDDYWDDPCGGRPAYFVPQDHLNEFEKES